MSERNCNLVINITGKGVTQKEAENEVNAVGSQVKISCTNKNQCIDDVMKKVDTVVRFLEEKHIYSTKSVTATEVCFSMAIFYDCLYKACVMFSKNIPLKLDYDDLKALRNDIGQKYPNAAAFMKTEIKPLITNIKTYIKNVGYEDAVILDIIAGLACDNITNLINGTFTDVIFGRDYVLEIEPVGIEPVVEETEPEPPISAKSDANSFVEGASASSYKDFAESTKTESDDSFDFGRAYAQVLDKVQKAKEDLEGIALVKSMLSPDLDKAGDKRAYVENILNDIKDTVNAKLKPLYDDAERSYKDIEQSFDKLIGKLIQLKDESLAEISVNV